MGRILTSTPWRTRSHRSGNQRPAWPFTVDRQHPLARGLIFHLAMVPLFKRDFAQNTPTALANFNDGTLVNTEAADWFRDREMGWGLDLDGTNEHISVSEYTEVDLERTDPFSVFAWCNPDSGGFHIILGKTSGANNTGYALANFTDADATGLRGECRQRGGHTIIVDSTALLTVGEWSLAGFTYDGSTNASGLHLFVNGITATDNVIADNLDLSMLNDAAVTVGARKGGTDSLFDGKVGPCFMWNRVLTAGEIWQMWNPPTRWRIYKEQGRVFFKPPAVVTGFHPTLALTGVGF